MDTKRHEWGKAAGVGALAVALILLFVSWRDVRGQFTAGRYGELRERPLPLSLVISIGRGEFGIQEYHYRLDTDTESGARSFTTIFFGSQMLKTRLSALAISALAAAGFVGIIFLEVIVVSRPRSTS